MAITPDYSGMSAAQMAAAIAKATGGTVVAGTGGVPQISWGSSSTPTATTIGSSSTTPLAAPTIQSGAGGAGGAGGSNVSNADLIASLTSQANQLQNQLNILKQVQAASGGKITDTSQIPADVLSGKSDLSTYLASLSQPKESDSVTMLKDLLAKSQQSYTDLLSKLQSQPTATQTYEELANKLGLSSKQAQMDTVEKQLKDLEDNINARASGMGLSEPLRQRLLAAEQRPLYKTYTGLAEDVSSTKENLSTLLNLAAQDKTYATQLAQLPLQSLQAQIPLYTALAEAASKLTPQQELQNAIAQAQAEQAIKGYSTIDTGNGIYQWNPDTKAYDIYVGPSKQTGTDKYTTPTNKKVSEYINWFEKLVKSGGVTAANWAQILSAWTNDGFNPNDFNDYFGKYAPSNISSGGTITLPNGTIINL